MARSAGSLVLALALAAAGCAGSGTRFPEPVAAPAPAASGRAVARPRTGPPAPPVPPAGQGVAASDAGHFAVVPGRRGLVIGVPHGAPERAADEMGRALGRLTGWGVVVARGFSSREPGGRRLDVSRPTESLPGAPAEQEAETAAARRAYEAYARHVAETARGPIRLYVEVEGDGREDEAAIEIVTVGIDRDDTWRLRTLLELVRDVHLGGRPEVARLDVRVEPFDAGAGTGAPAPGGLLGAVPRGLRIALPPATAAAHGEAYAAILADFLAQAADVVAAAPR